MSTRARVRREPVAQTGRQGAHVEEMQRQRLLLAIVEIVGENGLDAATVGRVCEQAGISRRTFYEIFTGREECLLAALDAFLERVSATVAPAYARTGRWSERVRDAVSLTLAHLDAEPQSARLCVIETLRAGPVVLERRREVLQALALAVDEGRTASRAGSEPPPLTAHGVIGGALSVIHTRLLEQASEGAARALAELTGPLTGMIVHPYLGASAARKELERPPPKTPTQTAPHRGADPFKGLPIRFTYRTARVLTTIATAPGSSNRHIADHSGITDEGQISRLLGRLHNCGLVENHSHGQPKGEPNAWTLTKRGEHIHNTITLNRSPHLPGTPPTQHTT